MSLTTPFSVQKLQTALHAKAKESPNFRSVESLFRWICAVRLMANKVYAGDS